MSDSVARSRCFSPHQQCASFVRVLEKTSPKDCHASKSLGFEMIAVCRPFQALITIDFRMAFKRSRVRFPSAPPPFAPAELRVAGHPSRIVKYLQPIVLCERRVSPEALAPGLRSRSGCFGRVGKGDDQFFAPAELRVAGGDFISGGVNTPPAARLR